MSGQIDVLGRELLRCKQWIEAALEYSGGSHSFEDIVRGCMEGNMQLWPAPKGCGVTEIVVYPKKKVLHVFLAGGELDQLIDMIEDAAEWGRQRGCEAMTMSGRAGWEKVLGNVGWKPLFRVMEKEL